MSAADARHATADDFRRVLAGLLTRLRAEPGAGLPGLSPCGTCAFRTTTDLGAGLERTVLGLIAAFGSAEPFYCHHGQPVVPGHGWHLTQAAFCAGFTDRVFTLTRDRLRALLTAAFRDVWPDWPALDAEGLADFVARAQAIAARAAAATDAAWQAAQEAAPC